MTLQERHDRFVTGIIRVTDDNAILISSCEVAQCHNREDAVYLAHCALHFNEVVKALRDMVYVTSKLMDEMYTHQCAVKALKEAEEI